MSFTNTGPVIRWSVVTPSDETTYANMRGIFVGGAGTLVLTGANGVDAPFPMPAGGFLPASPVKIKAASTATGIVACY